MIHPLPPEFSNRRIRCAVAGAGGSGSQMLSGLARMDVALRALGHPGLDVCVFDPDTVTEANIGRQLFSPSDLGANKASTLVNRINLFFGLNWNACGALYKAGGRWNDQAADILIGCVDSAAARRDLAQTRYHYWLDLGNTDKKGQVILGTRRRGKKTPIGKSLMEVFTENGMHPDNDYPTNRAQAEKKSGLTHKQYLARRKQLRKSVQYHTPPRPKLVTEIFPQLKNARKREDNTPSCSLAEALERQDLFINQTVATFALQLLWQFIRQGGLDIHGYFINLETGKVTPLPIK